MLYSHKNLYMLLSMTGFGKSTGHIGHKTITFEIKSVNSRNIDIRFKLPNSYRSRELELRRMITESAIRGKIDVLMTVDSEIGDEDFSFNEPLFKVYYEKLKSLQQTYNVEEDIMSAILRLPNIVKQNEADVNDDEWNKVLELVGEGLQAMKNFRLQEGDSIRKDFHQRVNEIQTSLSNIEPLEAGRLEKVRDRIRKNLAEFEIDTIDENRFEQELVYYLEKLDINEEKVRLTQHCEYFIESLEGDQESKGKILNFISQEMGREINTLGAKASDSGIQKHVVEMKDALEKIKEQIANVV